MAGGIVSKLAGFNTFIEVGEGATQPVFPVVHENQMQVLNLDSVEGRNADGVVIDYRTSLVVFHNGRELCRGETTVNDPLRCNGYTFHQATYSGNGVALQVKDRATGRVLWSEAPILQDQAPAPRPRLVVYNTAGELVLDTFFTMAPITQDRLAGFFAMPDSGRAFAVSAPLDTSANDWRLTVAGLPRQGQGDAGSTPVNVTLRPGERAEVGGYTFELPELAGNAYDVLTGVPGMERAALVQLAQDGDGRPYLDVVNMADRAAESARFQLQPGQSIPAGDYEYTFLGRREYTGVLVKRDPGSAIIWVAATLLIGGLLITFYVPRRRLWARVTPNQTTLAGLAERTAHLGDELAELGAEMQAVSQRSATGGS